MTISLLTTNIRSEQDVLLTRQRARQIAELLGFEAQDQTRISTAVSEIARNAVQYAGGGKVEFQLTLGADQSLLMVVKDSGPGISDIDYLLHMKAPLTAVRGRTLRGVYRLMDSFQIETSPTHGTTIRLGKQRPRRLPLLEPKDMPPIMNALMQRTDDDPLAEMRRQNQELLRTLEELRIQQEERQEHLREIETLNARLKRSVQATHHRVKNNLQIISALVEIQTAEGEASVPVAVMTRISQHTRALAAIHDLLTEETKNDAETEVISSKATMDKLMPLLQATTGGRSIHFQIDEFPISIRNGASLALLISEIISNAVKHAHNDITVTLAVQDDRARLEVCDDGPGFPADFDWREAANTGLALIDSTGRHDLKGTISYENRPCGGASVVVNFPILLSQTNDQSHSPA
jgi:two-component sensor histidine kinase